MARKMCVTEERKGQPRGRKEQAGQAANSDGKTTTYVLGRRLEFRLLGMKLAGPRFVMSWNVGSASTLMWLANPA